ncbi:NADP-dependent oxidoreductase [Nesterenkonia sphaerica]
MAYEQYGDPHTLQLMDLPTPKVGPGEVLIRAERAAVNPVDWKLMSGALDPMMNTYFPVIPGWDVYGVVDDVGPDVPEFSAGDRVASYARKDFVQGGTYAEYVSVPAASVAHVPDEVSADAAAGLPLAGLTALRCLQTLSVTEKDIVLIHAASGAVGRVASQLARELGARVIGTASEVNHQRLRDWGVEPVSYGEGLTGRVREVAPDGVTAVVDCVGGVLEQTLEVLTGGGRHVSIADPTVLEHQGRWVWVRPDGTRLESLLERVAEGRLSVDVDSVYPLERAAEAMQHNQRGARGKVLLDLTA